MGTKCLFIILALLCMAQMVVSVSVRNLQQRTGKVQTMTFIDKGLQAETSDVDMSKILLNGARYTFRGPMILSCSIYHPMLDEI